MDEMLWILAFVVFGNGLLFTARKLGFRFPLAISVACVLATAYLFSTQPTSTLNHEERLAAVEHEMYRNVAIFCTIIALSITFVQYRSDKRSDLKGMEKKEESN